MNDEHEEKMSRLSQFWTSLPTPTPPRLRCARRWRVLARDVVLGVVVVTFILMSMARDHASQPLNSSNPTHRSTPTSAAAVATPVVWVDANNFTREHYRANLRLKWMREPAQVQHPLARLLRRSGRRPGSASHRTPGC